MQRSGRFLRISHHGQTDSIPDCRSGSNLNRAWSGAVPVRNGDTPPSGIRIGDEPLQAGPTDAFAPGLADLSFARAYRISTALGKHSEGKPEVNRVEKSHENTKMSGFVAVFDVH